MKTFVCSVFWSVLRFGLLSGCKGGGAYRGPTQKVIGQNFFLLSVSNSSRLPTGGRDVILKIRPAPYLLLIGFGGGVSED